MSVKKNFRQALDEIVGGSSNAAGPVEPSRSSVRTSDVRPAYHGGDPDGSGLADNGRSGSSYADRLPVQPAVAANGLNMPAGVSAASVPAAAAAVPVAPAAPAADPRKEMTLITAGTVLYGNLATQSNLDIQGMIRGDVNCEGNIKITGRIEGNISCDNIEMQNAQVIGRINARQLVIMRGNSVLIGDINSDQMDIDGKIKGNLSAGNTILLHQNAYLLGDLSTRRVQFEFGAIVQGIMNVGAEDADASVFQAVSQIRD